jgi:hypothetical protein
MALATPEQVGAFPGVAQAFHRAELGGGGGQDDGAEAKPFEGFKDFLAARVTEVSGKETAVAYEDAESGLCVHELSAFSIFESSALDVRPQVLNAFTGGHFRWLPRTWQT